MKEKEDIDEKDKLEGEQGEKKSNPNGTDAISLVRHLLRLPFVPSLSSIISPPPLLLL